MAEIYLDDATYERLAEKLANLEPCAFYGRITTDQVKLVLGNQGNLWPKSLKAAEA